MKATPNRVLALVLAFAVVVGLSGCQAHTGAAAIVGGDRITEQDLATYVTSAAVPFQNTNGATIVPKSYVLQQIIEGRVLEAAIVAHGGAISADELAKSVASVIGGTTESAIVTQIAARGFTAKTEKVLVHTAALEGVFKNRFATATTAQAQAALTKSSPKISVNPLYGTWNPGELGVDPAKPDFLQLSSSAATATPSG